MTDIFLVRHGASQSNAGLPTLCPELVELIDKGWEQAEDIKRFLKEGQIFPDLIVTSSYLRTKQTAEPTTLAFPEAIEEQWPVEEFTYISTWHEKLSTLDDRRPAVKVYWQLANPRLIDGPGSESFEKFIVRVERVINRLKQTKLKTIVVFSHEQFICALLWLLQRNKPRTKLRKKDMREFRNFQLSHKIPNGAIVRINWQEMYECRRYQLITSHLRFPAGGSSSKDPILVDNGSAADQQRSGVDEGVAATSIQLRVRIGHQGDKHRRHQIDKALVAQQGGELDSAVGTAQRKSIEYALKVRSCD